MNKFTALNNPFTQPRRPSFAIEMQRNTNKAPTPTMRQQIVIYPRSDAIKRQAMRLANI